MNGKLGFTLKKILILVAIIVLIAAIAIPSFVKARNKSEQNTCINNLMSIDAGKEQCAMVYRLSDGDIATTAQSACISRGRRYVLQAVHTPAGTSAQIPSAESQHRRPMSLPAAGCSRVGGFVGAALRRDDWVNVLKPARPSWQP